MQTIENGRVDLPESVPIYQLIVTEVIKKFHAQLN